MSGADVSVSGLALAGRPVSLMKVELFRDFNEFKGFVEGLPAGLVSRVWMGQNSPTGDGWWAIVIVG